MRLKSEHSDSGCRCWEIPQRPISPNSLTQICQEVEAQQEKGYWEQGTFSSHFPADHGSLGLECSLWKFPFTQLSDHEVDLAEDSLTLNPPYREVGPAEMWRSPIRRRGKLSKG